MSTNETSHATDPTPLALVRRREEVGEPYTAEAFLLTSYVFEAALKLVALSLFAGLRRKAPDRAHEMAHELIRADGLGTWNQWIRTCVTQPTAAFLPSAYQEVVAWGTAIRNRKEDEWFRSAKADVDALYELLALESPLKSLTRPSVRDLLTAFTEIRGKTKAHGALGPDFFAAGARPYRRAVARLIDSCPVFRWKWLH